MVEVFHTWHVCDLAGNAVLSLNIDGGQNSVTAPGHVSRQLLDGRAGCVGERKAECPQAPAVAFLFWGGRNVMRKIEGFSEWPLPACVKVLKRLEPRTERRHKSSHPCARWLRNSKKKWRGCLDGRGCWRRWGIRSTPFGKKAHHRVRVYEADSAGAVRSTVVRPYGALCTGFSRPTSIYIGVYGRVLFCMGRNARKPGSTNEMYGTELNSSPRNPHYRMEYAGNPGATLCAKS